MKEHPILFSGAMVCAILAGQKTQTRRIVKPQPDHRTTHVSVCRDQWMGNGPSGNGVGTAQWDPWRKSPFAVGDRLWVRETWSDVNLYGAPAIAYRADGDLMDLMAHESFLDDDGAFNYEADRIKPYSFSAWASDLIGDIEGRWRPSIHMPRWASRILLEVVSVRVERLQDISEADADAEGCERLDFEREERDWKICPQCGGTRLHSALGSNGGVIPDCDCTQCDTYVKRYRHLWESINGAGSWAANPWVWVVEFRRVDA